MKRMPPNMKHINNNTFGALPLFLKALCLCHTPYARTHFPTFKFPDFSTFSRLVATLTKHQTNVLLLLQLLYTTTTESTQS